MHSVCIKSLLLHGVALRCNCQRDIQPPCALGSIFGAFKMLFVSMVSLIKQLLLSNNGVQISFLHTSFALGVYIHCTTACDQRAHTHTHMHILPINPPSFFPGHGYLLNSVSLTKSHERVKMTDKQRTEGRHVMGADCGSHILILLIRRVGEAMPLAKPQNTWEGNGRENCTCNTIKAGCRAL